MLRYIHPLINIRNLPPSCLLFDRNQIFYFMIRFGRTGSVNLCDKHSAVVLFATIHCRGVKKVGKKMAKIMSLEKRNAYIILINYLFEWSHLKDWETVMQFWNLKLFLSTLWRHVRGADTQQYWLIKHGGILQLECANYEIDIQKPIEMVRSHETGSEFLGPLLLCVVKETVLFMQRNFAKFKMSNCWWHLLQIQGNYIETVT